jgi:hypothetical protein
MYSRTTTRFFACTDVILVPFLRAARRGALAKSITGYHENMVRKQYPVLELANQMPVRIWIWPEPLVAPRVRRVLGYENGTDVRMFVWMIRFLTFFDVTGILKNNILQIAIWLSEWTMTNCKHVTCMPRQPRLLYILWLALFSIQQTDLTSFLEDRRGVKWLWN